MGSGSSSSQRGKKGKEKDHTLTLVAATPPLPQLAASSSSSRHARIIAASLSRSRGVSPHHLCRSIRQLPYEFSRVAQPRRRTPSAIRRSLRSTCRPATRSATPSHTERRPSKSAEPNRICTFTTRVAHMYPTRTVAPSSSTQNSTRVPVFSSLREADPTRALLRELIASRTSAYTVAESNARAAYRVVLHARAACPSCFLLSSRAA